MTTLLLAFFSSVFFTYLWILIIRFPVILTVPVKSAIEFSFSCVRRIRRIRQSPPPISGQHHSTGEGISGSLLNTLPTFVYWEEKRPKFGKEAGFCAICLSEFLNEQKLRWLPDCDHMFHLECIDTWFVSHKTCPCCRSNIERGGGEILLIENEDNLTSSEMGSLLRRLNSGDGGRYVDDRRRIGCERSCVSGLIRVLLMGRRRHHRSRPRNR